MAEPPGAMRGKTSVAASHAQPHPRFDIRPLDSHQVVPVGKLMFNAYLGTVDDHGETESWHRDQAERTFAGQFGEVVWPASKGAVVEDQLVGATVITFEDSRILVAFVLVVPHWQRRGVGTGLIAASAHEVLNLGHSEWVLAVTPGNPAIRLYERLGFLAAPDVVWKPPSSTSV